MNHSRSTFSGSLSCGHFSAPLTFFYPEYEGNKTSPQVDVRDVIRRQQELNDLSRRNTQQARAKQRKRFSAGKGKGKGKDKGNTEQARARQSLKSSRCVAQAKGHPLPLVQPSPHANPVISLLSFFRRGTCQKAEPKSPSVVKNLASPSFEGLSSNRGIGYASFIVTAFR